MFLTLGRVHATEDRSVSSCMTGLDTRQLNKAMPHVVTPNSTQMLVFQEACISDSRITKL